jgi:hypothetical protein
MNVLQVRPRAGVGAVGVAAIFLGLLVLLLFFLGRTSIILLTLRDVVKSSSGENAESPTEEAQEQRGRVTNCYKWYLKRSKEHYGICD